MSSRLFPSDSVAKTKNTASPALALVTLKQTSYINISIMTEMPQVCESITSQSDNVGK